MASPQEIAQRTEEYRVQQAILANTIAQAASIETANWLDVRNPDRGFAFLLARILRLLTEGRSTAYLDALLYYQDLRTMNGITGEMPNIPEPEMPIREIATSLHYNGPRYAKALIQREQTQNIGQVVGDAVGRAVVKHTLNAGRTTMMKAVPADKDALGWKRITDSDPCDFCKMLATRGAVYKSAKTAGNELNRYHDGCACVVVPVFK